MCTIVRICKKSLSPSPTVAYPNTAPDPDGTPSPDNRSTGNDNSVSLSVLPSSSSTRYPQRENRRPPDRLGYN